MSVQLADISPNMTMSPFPRRSEGYMRLLSYVVSNARAGEIMAIENYSEMVHLLDSTEAKIETVHQATEECKHILLLEKLADQVGFPIDQGLVQTGWKAVRAHFHDAVKMSNLAGCLIVQDLMVESLAIGLYKVFASASNGDAETSRVAQKLLKDELDHLEIGLRRIGVLLEKNREEVHDTLVWAHHRVVPELFHMVHSSCDFLCANIGLNCDIVDKGTVFIDLEMLKIASLEHYVDMLDRANFDTKITNALLASMGSYEVPGRANLGIDRVLARAGRACEPGDSKACC
jgi:fatty aldehyde decarbonylase